MRNSVIRGVVSMILTLSLLVPMIAVPSGVAQAASPAISYGDRVAVTEAGDGVAVRSSYSTSSYLIRTMGAGYEGEVISGPQYNQGYQWWYIRWVTGHTGWTADASLYGPIYLQPLPGKGVYPSVINNGLSYRVRVYDDIGTVGLNVRTGPSLSAGVKAKKYPGSRGWTTGDGPYVSTSEQLVWWYIEWDDGATGWSADSRGNIEAGVYLVKEGWKSLPSCSVNTPSVPSGTTSGMVNTSYQYSTGGSSCAAGHSVQYRFDWGDGTYSSWSSSTSAFKSWSSAGTYYVRAQARCATHTSVVSGWSNPLIVGIIPTNQLSFIDLQPPSITTSASTYDAMLTAIGTNFNNVNQITFTWSGPDSGTETWSRGSSTWNSRVNVISDTYMTFAPRVLSNAGGTQTLTWSWTVTLRDTTGATKSQSFTVTYMPEPIEVGRVILIEPLNISPGGPYIVGNTLTATFRVKNIGDAEITLDKLLLGGRYNDGELPGVGFPDFTYQTVTLQPGQSHLYQGTFTIPQPGEYDFFIAYYIENPTEAEKEFLDENNWNTCIELAEGLTDQHRTRNIPVDERPDIVELRTKINGLIEDNRIYLEQIKSHILTNAEAYAYFVDAVEEDEFEIAFDLAVSILSLSMQGVKGTTFPRPDNRFMHLTVLSISDELRLKDTYPFAWEIIKDLGGIDNLGKAFVLCTIEGYEELSKAVLGEIAHQLLSDDPSLFINRLSEQLDLEIDKYMEQLESFKQEVNGDLTSLSPEQVESYMKVVSGLKVGNSMLAEEYATKSILIKAIAEIRQADEEDWRLQAAEMLWGGSTGLLSFVVGFSPLGVIGSMSVTAIEGAREYFFDNSPKLSVDTQLMGLASDCFNDGFMTQYSIFGSTYSFLESVKSKTALSKPNGTLSSITNTKLTRIYEADFAGSSPKYIETVEYSDVSVNEADQDLAEGFEYYVTASYERPYTSFVLIPVLVEVTYDDLIPIQKMAPFEGSPITFIYGSESPEASELTFRLYAKKGNLLYGLGKTTVGWQANEITETVHRDYFKDFLWLIMSEGNYDQLSQYYDTNSNEIITGATEIIALGSPAELRVYDSQGRLTGQVNGVSQEQVPASICDDEHKLIAIFHANDSYHYDIVGTGLGNYSLEGIRITGEEKTDFNGFDIPITLNATHEYAVDWDALAQDEPGITIEKDEDGDGEVDEIIFTGVPETPADPSPSDGATAVSLNTTLIWSSNVSGSVTYNVYFGTDINPPLVSERQAETSYALALNLTTTYHWRVVAINEHGISSASPLWSFTTRGYKLITSSTNGGSVITPGEDVFAYEVGETVNLVAEPDEGYRFVHWTGDVDTVADVNAANTTITMNGHYSITANFEEAVQFPDPNLEAAIREAISKPSGKIYQSDLAGLTLLIASARTISDLTGLEHCTNLSSLDIHWNQITDISPLANLTTLTWLYLSYNQINDISPLANLTSLTTLLLENNRVSNIQALSDLTSLTDLDVGSNQISDISPLANLTNLTHLNLGDNQITDISPLANLNGLTSLHLWDNQMSNSDLLHLTSLTNLTDLGLGNNQISNVSPLANLTNLTWLTLEYNQISDISPLGNLANLTWLQLEYNEISDISALLENPGLGAGDTVDLRSNPLSVTSVNTYIPQLKARGVEVLYDMQLSGVWSRVDTPSIQNWILAPNSVIVDYAVADDGDVAYAIVYSLDTSQFHLLKSTDGAATWEDIINAMEELLNEGDHIAELLRVATDGEDSDFVAVALCLWDDSASSYYVNVFISNDGGSTFRDTGSTFRDTGEVEDGDDFDWWWDVTDLAVSPEDDDEREIAIAGSNLTHALIFRCTAFGDIATSWENATEYDGWDDDGAFTSAVVTDVKFAPSWAADKTILVTTVVVDYADDGVLTGDVYLQSGTWGTTEGWNEYSVVAIPAVIIVGGVNLPDYVDMVDARGIAGVTLPLDYSGRYSDKRYAWVWVNYYWDYGHGDEPTCTIFRVKNDDASPVGPMGQIEDGEVWLTNVDYLGYISEGKAIAGVLGDGFGGITECCEGVQVYRNDGIVNMDICCMPWEGACKPPTGRAAMEAFYVGDSPATSKSYAVALYGFEAYDEDAWSVSFDDGDDWNQLSLIDTHIDYLSDVAISPNCNKTMLVSVNEESGCECDSVWLHAEDLPEAEEYSGKWLRTWCGQLEGCIGEGWERGLLRLAPEETTGDTVYLVDYGTDVVYWNEMETLDCWEEGTATVDNIVDLAMKDKETIYALDYYGTVAMSDDYAIGWHEPVASTVENGWTIAVWGDHILVGGQHGEVSYCGDGGETFTALGDVVASGYVTVAFDSYFDTNDTIYAAAAGYEGSSPTTGGIYRWIIGESTEWENLGAEDYNYTGLVLNVPSDGKPKTSADTGGILYVSYVTEASGEVVTGVARCLRPADQLCCEATAWDYFDDGVAFDTAFAMVPSALKICGSPTPATNPTLFAIGVDTGGWEYDMENGRYGTVWKFIDAPRTWYVDDDLVDYPAADFTNIQDAVDAASPRDTIIVYPGTYIENVNVYKGHLTIQSQSEAETTLVQAANSNDHVFEVVRDHVNIMDLTVKGASGPAGVAGIYLNAVDYCVVSSNTFSNNFYGVRSDATHDSDITQNVANDNSIGIGLHGSSNNRIADNVVCNNGDDGIGLWNSNNNSIADNDSSSNNDGISLSMSDDNEIRNNNIVDNYYGAGLGLHGSERNVVTGNNLFDNYVGITLYSSSDNNFIYLNNCENSDPGSYDSASIWNSPEEITYMYGGNNYTNYLGNYWSDYFGGDADGDGIGETPYPIGSDADNYPLVEPFKNYEIGLAPKTWYVDDDLSDYPAADFTTIQEAVDAARPGDTIIAYPGTYTENVDVNKDHLTIQSENGAETTIVQAENLDDHILEVTADYVNVTGFTLDGLSPNWSPDQPYFGRAGIRLTRASYCNIFDNRVMDNNQGIILWHSSQNSIHDNYCNSCPGCDNENPIYRSDMGQNGIELYWSSENLVEDNCCEFNLHGIEVATLCLNNIIRNNSCMNNIEGIEICHSSNNNRVFGNQICKNSLQLEGMFPSPDGIYVLDSSGNIMRNNEVTGYRRGISLYNANDNQIYLNDFIGNEQNVLLHDSTNIWESPEQAAYTYNGNTYTNYLGNYWDDYAGGDTDGDGIGDTPYPVNGDSDNYPLMEPFEDYCKRWLYGIPVDFRFETDLSKESNGPEVRYLQIVLNTDPDTKVAIFGDGSPGDETTTFDSLTEDAVRRFQVKHGLPETGFVCEATREKLNERLAENFTEEYKSQFGLLDEEQRKATIWEYITEFKDDYLPEDFPPELVLAIAAQEIGEHAHWNNEHVANDWGRGIMQIIRDFTTDGFYGFVGKGGVDSDSEDCTRASNRENQKVYSSKYYSNTLAGFEANVRDGLYGLRCKCAGVDEDNINPPEGYTKEELVWMLTVQRYNGFRIEPSQYICSVGDKLIRLADGEYGDFMGFNKGYARALGEKFKSTHNERITLHSPVQLHVYDDEGNVAGLMDEVIKVDIPNSVYDTATETVLILCPSGDHYYKVTGLAEGTYGLSASFFDAGASISFDAIGIPIAPGAVHQYHIDWAALAQTEEGVTVEIDSDGDGIFEELITCDSELTQEEFVLQTATTVDFDPDVLNLETKGKYVTAYIELPAGYDVSQIDITSIKLNDTVPALTKPTEIGDYDNDGIPDLMVKFDRAAVKALLTPDSQVEITITGEVAGIGFEGSDTVRVINN